MSGQLSKALMEIEDELTLSTPKKSGNGKRTLTTKQTIAKRLRETKNLKDLDHTVKDGCVDENGHTFRKVLEDDLEKFEKLSAAEKKKMPQGKRYYDPLIEKFTKLAKTVAAPPQSSSAGSAQQQQLPVRAHLFKAMMQWQGVPQNREGVTSFLLCNPTDLNDRELAGVVNCFISLKPKKTNQEHVLDGLKFIDYFAFVKLQEKQQFYNKVRPFTDTCLNAALESSKNKKEFKEVHLSKLLFLFGEQTYKRIKEETEDWANVRDDIVQVCAWNTGKTLFQTALDNVNSKKILSMLDDALKAFMDDKTTEWSLEGIKKTIGDCTTACFTSPYAETLPEKRKIQVVYRGTTWQTEVKSIGTQIMRTFWFAIKTYLVDHGYVKPILCEDSLVASRASYPKEPNRTINAALIEKLQKAREKANAALNALELLDTESVKAELAKCSAQIAQSDHTFKDCELEFWKELGTGAGSRALYASFFEYMPSKDNVKKIADVRSCIVQLTHAPVFKFAGEAAQNQVQKALASLGYLELSEDLQLPDKATEFLLMFKDSLLWFAEHEGAYGRAALDAMVDEVSGKTPENVDDELLTKLFQFSFALTPENYTALKEIGAKIDAMKQEAAGGAKSSQTSSSSKAVEEAKARGQALLQESAMNMFDM